MGGSGSRVGHGAATNGVVLAYVPSVGIPQVVRLRVVKEFVLAATRPRPQLRDTPTLFHSDSTDLLGFQGVSVDSSVG